MPSPPIPNAQAHAQESHSPVDGTVFRITPSGFNLTRPATRQTWHNAPDWPRVLSCEGFSPSGKSLFLLVLPQTQVGAKDASAARAAGLFRWRTCHDGTAQIVPVETLSVPAESMPMSAGWHLTQADGWSHRYGWICQYAPGDADEFPLHSYMLKEDRRPGASFALRKLPLPGPYSQRQRK